MAVPKRKTGRARTHARRSENDKIASPSRSVCPKCGEVKLPHRKAIHKQLILAPDAVQVLPGRKRPVFGLPAGNHKRRPAANHKGVSGLRVL